MKEREHVTYARGVGSKWDSNRDCSKEWTAEKTKLKVGAKNRGLNQYGSIQKRFNPPH